MKKSKLSRLAALLAAGALLVGGMFMSCSTGGDDDDDDGGSTGGSGTDSGVISLTAPSTAGAVTLFADTDTSTALYSGTSVQEALEYLMTNSSTGNYTISVASGTYNEMLFYTGSAQITIEGTGSASYGTDVVITYSNSGNSNAMATLASNHSVTSGYFRGATRFDGTCTLILKNVTIQNSYSRSANDGSNTQAEALVFSSTGNLIAYNSSFLSHQDTLYLGNKGGRMWFYKDYIAGDVDFIWGYMDVALFEECSLYCRGDEATKSYIFASRAITDDKANKGIVLLNNSIEIASGVTAWYGRNSGSDTQAAILNSTITGSGSIDSSLYDSAPTKYVTDVAGDLAIGYKDYNNTMNGTLVDTSSRLSNCGELSARVAKREYNGRWAILNRGYSEDDEVYETASTIWDVSSYESEFSATADTSKENVYVEPVYKKNVVGGNTVQLTPSTTSDSTLTYTYASSDESLATVDENGLVTTVSGADGTVTITVTGSNGNTDTAQILVIPTYIEVNSVAFASDTITSSNLYVLNTLSATLSAEDTTKDVSDTTVTWTASNETVLKFYDSSDNKFVSELKTSSPTVQVYAVATGSATVTVTSVDGPSATSSTITVSSTVTEWNPTVAGVLVNTDVQSGVVGTYNTMIIDASTNNKKNNYTAKMGLKVGNTSCQTRNVILNIPVTADCDIVVTLKAAPTTEATSDTASGLNYGGLYADGTKVVWDSDALTYTIKFDYDTQAVTGDKLEVTSSTAGDSTGDFTSETSYAQLVFGSSDVYITSITRTTNGQEYTYDAATAYDVAVAFSDTSDVTLDLNGTTTSTRDATVSGNDASSVSVTYTSSNTGVATVDSSTGAVTAAGMGCTTITASVPADDQSKTYATDTYLVYVKDTSEEDSYKITFTSVVGATDSTVDYDFGKFSTTGSYYHDESHGWAIGASGTLTVHVTGASTITLGCCDYGDHTENGITVSDGTNSSTLTLADGEGVTVEYSYTGTDATDITFKNTATKEVYLHSISVVSTSAATVYATAQTYDFRTDDYTTYSGYTSALNGFEMSGGSKHGTTYGWDMKVDSTLTLVVSGSCTVTFLGSKYSSLSMAATASTGTITPEHQTTLVTKDCTDTYVFTYSGEAATLVFTASQNSDDSTSSGTDAYVPTVTLAYSD